MGEKKGKKIHLFHSIKGGCGKTTCALLNSIDILRNAKEKKEKKNIALIDADFRGTGLYTTLTGKKPFENEEDTTALLEAPEPEENLGSSFRVILSDDFYNTLFSDCVANNSILDEVFFGDYKTRITGFDNVFDIYICAPQHEYKLGFVSNTSVNEGNTVRVSLFRDVFREMILHLYEKENYDEIIIDLSPGIDEYTKSIKEVIFDYRDKISKEMHIISYIISTGDEAHLKAAAEYLVDQITKTGSTKKISDEIEIILNNVKQRFPQPIGKNPVTNITVETLIQNFQGISNGINKFLLNNNAVQSKNIDFAIPFYYEDYIREFNTDITRRPTFSPIDSLLSQRYNADKASIKVPLSENLLKKI